MRSTEAINIRQKSQNGGNIAKCLDADGDNKDRKLFLDKVCMVSDGRQGSIISSMSHFLRAKWILSASLTPHAAETRCWRSGCAERFLHLSVPSWHPPNNVLCELLISRIERLIVRLSLPVLIRVKPPLMRWRARLSCSIIPQPSCDPAALCTNCITRDQTCVSEEQG